jgi:hypothetical protein
MKVLFHGIEMESGHQLVWICGDPVYGQSYLLRTTKQEVEVRITPKGSIRLGEVKKAGRITAKGYQ